MNIWKIEWFRYHFLQLKNLRLILVFCFIIGKTEIEDDWMWVRTLRHLVKKKFTDVSEIIIDFTISAITETINISETSVNLYFTKWRDILKDIHLNTRRCENLKSQIDWNSLYVSAYVRSYKRFNFPHIWHLMSERHFIMFETIKSIMASGLGKSGFCKMETKCDRRTARRLQNKG